MRIPRARLTRIVVAVVVTLAIGSAKPAPLGATPSKLDALLQAQPPFGRSRVVLRVTTPQALSGAIWLAQLLGGIVLRQLPVINAVALDVPNAVLPALAASPAVVRISFDRMVSGANERTAATVGATAVRSRLGLNGSGVGIAIIDSGAMVSHDDLAPGGGVNRIDRFVDFTSSATAAYDDFGHGTHVAGIIAGNGVDSSGARSGIAPDAHLTVLKAIDDEGHGRISDVIAAIGYAVSHRTELNIRVINLSVAAGVYESYSTDPLTLAAREAVEDGIVVVAAAGNNGRGPQGQAQYGGITAPGNAPWVLTVGASSHMGTVARGDDTIATFSSRGPTAIDAGAKPDLVSPGVGIESLSDPLGSLYVTNAAGLLPGTVTKPYLPYMSLSGTSMSAPVVSGTVALMLQANPALTPNAVKAILQFTAQTYTGYDPLTQGAGFLNADGAVSLAAWFAAPTTTPYPDASTWSGHLIWGTRILEGSGVTADAVPWAANVTWGDPSQPGFSGLANVVWGSLCGGADCQTPWNNQNVTTTSDEEGDTVVWGTSDEEGDTVVWGTSCTDPSCEAMVWGSQ